MVSTYGSYILLSVRSTILLAFSWQFPGNALGLLSSQDQNSRVCRLRIRMERTSHVKAKKASVQNMVFIISSFHQKPLAGLARPYTVYGRFIVNGLNGFRSLSSGAMVSRPRPVGLLNPPPKPLGMAIVVAWSEPATRLGDGGGSFSPSSVDSTGTSEVGGFGGELEKTAYWFRGPEESPRFGWSGRPAILPSASLWADKAGSIADLSPPARG